MLLATRQSLERSLAGIEWPTLFFFMGLFVMVGALEETGAIEEVADGIAYVTGGDRTAELLGIAVGVRARVGDRRQHPVHGDDDPRRRAAPGGPETTPTGGRSSIGACFGGNATLIAAAANVAAAGMAARAGRRSASCLPEDRAAGHAPLDGDRDRLHRRGYL